MRERFSAVDKAELNKARNTVNTYIIISYFKYEVGFVPDPVR